jgi:hypothetical protein
MRTINAPNDPNDLLPQEQRGRKGEIESAINAPFVHLLGKFYSC